MSAAALIVGAAGLASRVVGVLRDRLLAGTYGASSNLDAYYAAFRLPDFLYTLFIFGALTAGFIPVFAEYLERRGKAEAYALAEEVFAVVGAAMAVVCVGLAVGASWLVPAITPGFTGEKLATTIQLTRIMALSPFLLGLSAVMGGILQTMRKFVAFALAPVLYNLGIIFGITVLSPRLGMAGVAWGVVVGAGLHFLAQASVVRGLGCCRIRRPSVSSEGVQRILKLMLPRAAGLAVSQVNLVIVLAFASSLENGSISVLNLANNLQGFPLGLIGISFAIAAFPELARAFGARDDRTFTQVFASAARKMMFFLIPATALFLLLRAQIVRLVFGMGAFDWDDTIRTADVLALLAISLPAQAMVPLFTRAFYAIQETWLPVKIGIVSELVNLALILLLRDRFGVAGLAIAFSAAAVVQVIGLAFFLRQRRGPMEQRAFWVSVGKTTAASFAFLAAAYPVRQWLGTVYPLHTFLQVAAQFSASVFVGTLVFIGVAKLVRSEELLDVLQSVKKRLWRRQTLAEGVDEATAISQS